MFAANLITGLVGIALLIAFLGILVGWLKALPLIIIAVGCVLLLVYDFVSSLRESNGTNGV
jgi:hypothetical protein